MYLTELESKVLYCGKKRIAVRAVRGGGKTELAFKWAKEQTGKKVLFISAGIFNNSRVWHGLIMNRYGKFVLNSSSQRIEFEDGTVIYYLGYKQLLNHSHRGLSYDCLVVDDAEYVSHRWIENIPEKVLILGSGIQGEKDNLMEWALKTPEFHVVRYDYLDAIRDGIYTLEEVYDMYKSYKGTTHGLQIFQEEFGPWD